MAAVSLTVNCGCLNDPLDRQGIAHFLEHMIFMGSSKYPSETQFSSLIASHGGYTNAYTEWEYTNYQFRIDQKVLYQALDIFAWFLKDPLLSKDAMDREIKSMESEFESNYPYDTSRRLQLMCNHTTNEKHPINLFSFGNLKSLKSDNPEQLWDDLKQFYQKHYSAERMRLVIQVKTMDNLKDLKKQVSEIFAQIPNKNFGLQNFSIIKNEKPVPLPYEGNEDEIIVFNSVKNSSTLSLLFTLPYNVQRQQNKTLFLISSLLNHEGQGSLYQFLKRKELILSIDGSEDATFRTVFNLLQVDIKLTEKGLKDYIFVIASFFKYINFIYLQIKENLSKNLKLDLFEEVKLMGNLGFDFYKVPNQLDNVVELSIEMLFNKRYEKLLKDTYSEIIVDKIDYQEILETLSEFMTLEKSKILISSKNILDQANQIFGSKNSITSITKEKWFKTKYQLFKRQNKIINKTLSKMKENDQFFIPQKNPLIPENFKILADIKLEKNEQPIILEKNNKYEVRIMQDKVYQMPRAVVYIIFINKKVFQTPRERAYFGVYTEAFIEAVTAKIGHEAVLADTGYSIKAFENIGFKLKFSGYNDKIPTFIDLFLEIMSSTSKHGFEDWLVNLALEREIKTLKNANVEVDQRTSNNRLQYMLENQFHSDILLQELNKFDKDYFNQKYAQETLLGHIQYYKILVCGNVNGNQAIAISNSVQETLLKDYDYIGQETCSTKVAQIMDNELIQWDCVHEQKEFDDSDEENESMEDLTDEAHHQDKSLSDKSEEDKESQDDEGSETDQEENSCIQVYFQGKDNSLENYISLQLLESIMDENFYDQMRNKEQLGYYVSATHRNTRGVDGFLFVIESAEYDPLYLQERIYLFIEDIYKRLKNDETLFKEYYDGLVTRKKEGFQNIKEESQYLLSQMKEFAQDQQQINWLRLEQELHFLQSSMTRELLIKKFESTILNQPRTAIFRVFSQKYKALSKFTQLETLAHQNKLDAERNLIELKLKV